MTKPVGTIKADARMSADDLALMVKEGHIDTVLVCMTDMQGRLIGKRLTGRYFVKSAMGPSDFCEYLLATDLEMALVPGYAAASWESGYGDFTLMPDLSTLRIVPWLPGTAMVLCDVVDRSGQPFAHSPRAILKRQIGRLAQHGLRAQMAAEYEFYVADGSYADIRAGGYRDIALSSPVPQDGHIFQSTKDEPLLRRLRQMLEAAGIPVEGSKAEWSGGQHELNLEYCDALEMADRLVVTKNACKEIAHQEGKAVTFMAKLDSGLAGSSMHMHLSVERIADGSSAFVEHGDPGGMSSIFQHFLGGAIRHAPAATLFWAPYVNSYRRFREGSFAPTRLAWSEDNRSTAFRVVGQGRARRFECRVPGADANPYLAFAALIAAGIAGLEEAEPLQSPLQGNGYGRTDIGRIPADLPAALAALENAPAMHAALGPDVVQHYLHAGRHEYARFQAEVTDHERRQLFELC